MTRVWGRSVGSIFPPHLLDTVDHEVGGDLRGGEPHEAYRLLRPQNPEGGQRSFGLEVVVAGGLGAAAGAPAREQADLHYRLGIERDPRDTGIFVRRGVELVHAIEYDEEAG